MCSIKTYIYIIHIFFYMRVKCVYENHILLLYFKRKKTDLLKY